MHTSYINVSQNKKAFQSKTTRLFTNRSGGPQLSTFEQVRRGRFPSEQVWTVLGTPPCEQTDTTEKVTLPQITNANGNKSLSYLAVPLCNDSVPPAVSDTCRHGDAGDVAGSEREREADAGLDELQRDELIRVPGARLVVQQQRVLLQRRELHLCNIGRNMYNMPFYGWKTWRKSLKYGPCKWHIKTVMVYSDTAWTGPGPGLETLIMGMGHIRHHYT